jgi:hypothetical protein
MRVGLRMTWPVGRFNLAMIRAELNIYVDAVDSMKHYFAHRGPSGWTLPGKRTRSLPQLVLRGLTLQAEHEFLRWFPLPAKNGAVAESLPLGVEHLIRGLLPATYNRVAKPRFLCRG